MYNFLSKYDYVSCNRTIYYHIIVHTNSHLPMGVTLCKTKHSLKVIHFIVEWISRTYSQYNGSFVFQIGLAIFDGL